MQQEHRSVEATLETLNEQFKLLQIERDTEVDALSKQVNQPITAFFSLLNSSFWKKWFVKKWSTYLAFVHKIKGKLNITIKHDTYKYNVYNLQRGFWRISIFLNVKVNSLSARAASSETQQLVSLQEENRKLVAERTVLQTQVIIDNYKKLDEKV